MKSSSITKYNPYGLEVGDVVKIKSGRKTSNGYSLTSIDTAVIECIGTGKSAFLVSINCRGVFLTVWLDVLVPAKSTKITNDYGVY